MPVTIPRIRSAVLSANLLGPDTPLHARQSPSGGDNNSSGNDNTNNNSGGFSTVGIIVAAVVAALVVIVGGYIVLRSVRRRHPGPKYIPTPLFKRLWTGWNVPASRTGYHATGDDDYASTRGSGRMREAQDELEGALAAVQGGRRRTGAAAVDRNTSVRSVMTLPAYRPRPNDTEQVLGREGERDGVDMVVEFPTMEDEETLRDEEMEALYQIRLARRRQITEREELRQQRREARQRNDLAALEEIRRRGRTLSSNSPAEIDTLRREHERAKETRQRAVSSVSYAELGVARADGTRLRANSSESERVGLLSDAESMGANPISPTSTRPSSLLHRRDRSASSVMSINTGMGTERPGSPGLATGDSAQGQSGGGRARSRASSEAPTPRVSISTPRAGSSPEIIDAEEGDLGESDMPPPGYDDVSLDDLTPINSRGSGRASPYSEPPPDYPGPSKTRNNRLSAHMEDLVAEATHDDPVDSRRSSRSGLGTPRLPSLRLNRLPQIVIEPSSAAPRDDTTE